MPLSELQLSLQIIADLIEAYQKQASNYQQLASTLSANSDAVAFQLEGMTAQLAALRKEVGRLNLRIASYEEDKPNTRH